MIILLPLVGAFKLAGIVHPFSNELAAEFLELARNYVVKGVTNIPHLVIINALFLVQMPLMIASIFTRSITTVLTVCSDYLRNLTLVALDNEENNDLAMNVLA